MSINISNLKSFKIVEISTGREYSSDCTFYSDGVLCNDVDGEGNYFQDFIKNGDFIIEEVTFELQKESYLHLRKIDEIFDKLWYENWLSVEEYINQNYSTEQSVSKKYSHIDNKAFRKFDEAEQYKGEVLEENKKWIHGYNLIASINRFASHHTNSSQFLDWLVEDIKVKHNMRKLSDVNQISEAIEAINELSQISLNDLVEMAITHQFYQNIRSNMYDKKRAELREIAKQMASIEVSSK